MVPKQHGYWASHGEAEIFEAELFEAEMRELTMEIIEHRFSAGSCRRARDELMGNGR
jgi:hypothetical protein